VRPTAYDVGKSLKPFKNALEFIAQNYHRKISIGELARLSNMSERNFTRRFVQAMRCSPHRYVTDTRIAMACGQLASKDPPVSSVAECNGFFSISSFNRAFRRTTGVSPREWRKRYTSPRPS